ncbi:hypothetical protein MRX96_016777 [Rhipicephalus microplus]
MNDSLSDDEVTRQTARQQVNQLGERPDFNDYMAFIFTEMKFQNKANPKEGQLILKKFESVRRGVAPPRVSVDDPSTPGFGTAPSLSSVYYLSIVNRPLSFHADAFVTNLLQLALDTDYEVQKAMCRALALLLEYHIDCLIPHMCCIVEYVMNRMQDAEEDVAVEARATLFCLAKPICKEALTPHFSSLVHILLNGTKYCDTAAERLKQVIPGTIQNPGSIYRGRESIDYGLVSGTKVPLDNILYARNLRTSSAIALGAISTVFNEELLTLLRPYY